MTERFFPIQSEAARGVDGQYARPIRELEASRVPWWLAELAYKSYSKHCGTSQSLERLAERGGFGHYEFVVLLRGGNPFGSDQGWKKVYSDMATP